MSEDESKRTRSALSDLDCPQDKKCHVSLLNIECEISVVMESITREVAIPCISAINSK